MPETKEELRERLNNLAAFLDRQFNGDDAEPNVLMKEDKRQFGFVLLVFPFTDAPHADSSQCHFVSNGTDRNDIIALFKEMTARFEGQPDVAGHA